MIDSHVRIEVPESTLENWQEVVNTLAEFIPIPVALIMRLNDPHIEVFVSSQSVANPYHRGDKEVVFGSGLYCETVIRTKEKLLVPNALSDPNWKDNPDVKLGMISYLGFPIFLPDEKPFGTLCVLDNKQNAYSPRVEKMMVNFRNLLQSHLEMIYLNQVLGDKNKRLSDYLMELQALRGMVSICSGCKSIKDAQGNWRALEEYLIKHPEADFSHGLCPKCLKNYSWE